MNILLGVIVVGISILMGGCGNRTSFEACYEKGLQVAKETTARTLTEREVKVFAFSSCAPGNR